MSIYELILMEVSVKRILLDLKAESNKWKSSQSHFGDLAHAPYLTCYTYNTELISSQLASVVNVAHTGLESWGFRPQRASRTRRQQAALRSEDNWAYLDRLGELDYLLRKNKAKKTTLQRCKRWEKQECTYRPQSAACYPGAERWKQWRESVSSTVSPLWAILSN